MTAVVAQGAGELLTDEARRRVVVKADRDELAVTVSRYAEGEGGPDAHFHREHSDCFFVLEGRLVFELDGERTEATAGDFVAVPRWSSTRSATSPRRRALAQPPRAQQGFHRAPAQWRRPGPLRHLRPIRATGGS